MRRPGGYLICDDPDPTKSKGQVGRQENDTFTCGHCGRIVIVKPLCDPADMGGLCGGCGALVCPGCHGRGVCDPLEEKLRRDEERDRFRRSIGG